ncbi:unnamed protein product [Caenorhabditis angaria]|uniref:Copper transport protein n=1 Tax=Caenorhabditis angaria TaxID=860376 RepID=A0A9P1MY19_9PELO|nr:unnamed protein product [Caenorhabditis angaria]
MRVYPCLNRSKMDMDMTLHFGDREKILFSWWKTGSVLGMAVSMLITFLLCILYEAIKSFRYFLAIWEKQKRAMGIGESTADSEEIDERAHIAPIVQFSGYIRKLFTKYRLAQCGLYGIQMLLAYVLMLIVMTFNVNLILSVVFGTSVGYFLFTGTPFVEGQVADCC